LITPHLRGMSEFKHLSYASSLCGKCSEVCPVKIDIHKMLLLNRRDAVASHLPSKTERLAWKGFTYAITKRKLVDFFSGKFKNFLLRNFFRKAWGKRRQLPHVAEKSFSQQWKAQNK